MRYYVSMFMLTCLFGCLSARLERTQGDLKTIGYYTGVLSKDEGVYYKQFERGAEKACDGRPYDVLERTRSPSTLSGMDLPSSKFYWVVRCK